MRFRVTPTVTFVEGRIPQQAVTALDTALRFHPRGYAFSPAYKKRHWDGWMHLLKITQGQIIFPSGLLTDALAAVHAYPPELAWEIPAAPAAQPVTDLPDGTALYADQCEAVRTVIAQQRGLLALATNFGKTNVIAGIIASYPAARCLVLLDARPLLQQTAARLAEALRITVGRFGGGERPSKRDRVVVATVQSCSHFLDHPTTQEWLQSFDVLIVDEVHTVSPKLWFPTLVRCPAPVRIGLSGTVHESEQQMVMRAFFGDVLMTVREAELVEQGRSAEPWILMPYCGNVIPDGTDYRLAYRVGIVESFARNALLVRGMEWAVQARHRTLALCYQIDHVKALTTLLRSLDARPRVAALHGSTPSFEIEDAKKHLMERRLDVIVASTIFNKGIDLPDLEVLVNAAAWKSPLATKQKAGRMLRRKTVGPNRAILIDPYDLGNRILKNHAHKRERLYAKQGFKVFRGQLMDLLTAHAHVLDDERAVPSSA